MAYYLFNSVAGEAVDASALRARVAGLLGAGLWGVGADEPHRDALAPGDVVLIYLGAPERVFVGGVELTSAVHSWTPSEARAYPGDAPAGVALSRVEEWDPPVPMEAVLSRIGPSEKARADFEWDVMRITPDEYAIVRALAAGR